MFRSMRVVSAHRRGQVSVEEVQSRPALKMRSALIASEAAHLRGLGVAVFTRLVDRGRAGARPLGYIAQVYHTGSTGLSVGGHCSPLHQVLNRRTCVACAEQSSRCSAPETAHRCNLGGGLSIRKSLHQRDISIRREAPSLFHAISSPAT